MANGEPEFQITAAKTLQHFHIDDTEQTISSHLFQANRLHLEISTVGQHLCSESSFFHVLTLGSNRWTMTQSHTKD